MPTLTVSVPQNLLYLIKEYNQLHPYEKVKVSSIFQSAVAKELKRLYETEGLAFG